MVVVVSPAILLARLTRVCLAGTDEQLLGGEASRLLDT
jgi:hypothetical protein